MQDSALVQLELLTKDYAAARKEVETRVMSHRALMLAVTRRRLPGIKSAVANAHDAKAKVANFIDAHRHLFEKPKSQTFHGIKVGLKKGTGSIEVDDEEAVIALIEKELPEKKDLLIKVKKSAVKKQIGELNEEELAKIGVTREGTEEYVLIKDTVSDVDKLVTALLKEGKAVEEED